MVQIRHHESSSCILLELASIEEKRGFHLGMESVVPLFVHTLVVEEGEEVIAVVDT